MKKLLWVCLLVMLMIPSLTIAESGTFDHSILEIYDGYSYDKFDKKWSYVECYRKTYSDGYVDVGLQVTPYNDELQISLYSRILDSQLKEIATVTAIDFLIDDTTYSFELQHFEDSNFSAINLGKEKVLLLRAMANADEIAIRLSCEQGVRLVVEPSVEDYQATLREAAQVIVFYNLFDYVVEFAAEWDSAYPLLIDGETVNGN